MDEAQPATRLALKNRGVQRWFGLAEARTASKLGRRMIRSALSEAEHDRLTPSAVRSKRASEISMKV